ncbi:MAG: site-specific integrase [Clostridia bacterium]|nr:site-specific integrase [Clostridia bacterium]
MTYDEWFIQYLALYKRKIKPKTRESYERLHQLLAPIHDTALEDLTPDQLQAALIHVEQTAGSRQAQLAYTLLSGALARAVRSGHIKSSPMAAIDKPEHVGQEGRALTPEDWEAVLPEIRQDAALALLAFAGLRRGELLGLRRGDVDLAAGLIRIRRQRVRVNGRMVTTTPKSKSGVRDVPILPELRPILAAACRLMLPTAPLCSCAPETLARRWRSAQERAKIREPYRLHDLRHTYATRMVLAGCNPRILQYMIGHSTLDLTMKVYTHIDGNTALQEVSRLGISLH